VVAAIFDSEKLFPSIYYLTNVSPKFAGRLRLRFKTHISRQIRPKVKVAATANLKFKMLLFIDYLTNLHHL